MSAIRNIIILGGIGAGVYFASKVARGQQLVGSPIKCFPLERFGADCMQVVELEVDVGSVNGDTYDAYFEAPAPGFSQNEQGPRAVSGSLRFGKAEMLVRYPDGSEVTTVSSAGMTASEYLDLLRNAKIAEGEFLDRAKLMVRSAPGPQAKIDLGPGKDLDGTGKRTVDPYDTDVKAELVTGSMSNYWSNARIPDVSLVLEVGDWMKGSTVEVLAEVFGYAAGVASSEALPHRAVYKFKIEVT